MGTTFSTGERVLMSEERLAAIEAAHIAENSAESPWCDACDCSLPCDAVELVTEVRELRRLLEML